MNSQHRVYKICLPLINGREAVLAGVCLDQITNTFPLYLVQGHVKDHIFKAFKEKGNEIENFPNLPKFVGGDIYIMIGSKYLPYHPRPIFSLTNGLTVINFPWRGGKWNC